MDLPKYEERLKLLNMPSLNKHRDYLRVSFVCKIINGTIDCPYILGRLHFHINYRNLRSITFFSLANYHTNYGRFSPLNAILIIYNKYSKYLMDNNANCTIFKSHFYND